MSKNIISLNVLRKLLKFINNLSEIKLLTIGNHKPSDQSRLDLLFSKTDISRKSYTVPND